jgi:hypothetical protein
MISPVVEARRDPPPQDLALASEFTYRLVLNAVWQNAYLNQDNEFCDGPLALYHRP